MSSQVFKETKAYDTMVMACKSIDTGVDILCVGHPIQSWIIFCKSLLDIQLISPQTSTQDLCISCVLHSSKKICGGSDNELNTEI